MRLKLDPISISLISFKNIKECKFESKDKGEISGMKEATGKGEILISSSCVWSSINPGYIALSEDVA